MQPDPDDDVLLDRFRSGDEAALRRLFDRHEPQIRVRVARRIPADLTRKFAVEDILQEAYLTAFRRIGEFESVGDDAFGVWVSAIALNKLREEIRRYRNTVKRGARREVTRGARPDTVWFQGRNPSPSECAMGEELRLRVDAAVAALPDDYRVALNLVQTERLTMREAAERMGRTREAMKKLYGRAVARLASLLET